MKFHQISCKFRNTTFFVEILSAFFVEKIKTRCFEPARKTSCWENIHSIFFREKARWVGWVGKFWCSYVFVDNGRMSTASNILLLLDPERNRCSNPWDKSILV